MKVPYIHSNFKRIENDNYQTIDPRCVYGFLEHFIPRGDMVDICAPFGSEIVNTLNKCGYNAYCLSDAFEDNITAEWIITNPPYTRPLIDQIIVRQLERIVDGDIYGVAMLLRSNFDFAKSRVAIFSNTYYYGQIKLRFRPWWSDNRKAQPIHNYVWQIWTETARLPRILYANGTIPTLGGLEAVQNIKPKKTN